MGKEGGAAQGNSMFSWGSIRGTSQNSGREGLKNDEEERRGEMERGMRQVQIYTSSHRCMCIPQSMRCIVSYQSASVKFVSPNILFVAFV